MCPFDTYVQTISTLQLIFLVKIGKRCSQMENDVCFDIVKQILVISQAEVLSFKDYCFICICHANDLFD